MRVHPKAFCRLPPKLLFVFLLKYERSDNRLRFPEAPPDSFFSKVRFFLIIHDCISRDRALLTAWFFIMSSHLSILSIFFFSKQFQFWQSVLFYATQSAKLRCSTFKQFLACTDFAYLPSLFLHLYVYSPDYRYCLHIASVNLDAFLGIINCLTQQAKN